MILADLCAVIFNDRNARMVRISPIFAAVDIANLNAQPALDERY